MEDVGVTTTMGGSEFLEAMARSKQVDPTMALPEKAIKATVKGGKANCGSATGARCRTTSRGRRSSGQHGAPTSGPPCSPTSGSASTAS
ncbi:hypothetical protein GCM10010320_79680 [Streptomyces caelestis]|nr:hypothetical protein GCM10010320_79680 [Streptomyces caelestis]